MLAGHGTGEIDVIIENWGHADLVKKYIDELKVGHGRRPDRATRASSAGTSRRGWPRSTRTSPSGRTSTSTPTCSRPPSPAARASSSTATRRTSRTTRRSSRTSSSTTRWSPAAREAAPRSRLPAGRGEQDAAARLLLRPAVVLRRGAARQGRAARVHRGLRRRREARSPATTRRTQLNKLISTKFADSGSTRRGPHQEVQWTNDDQNAVSEVYRRPRNEPGGRREEVGRGQPGQGRRLALLSRRHRRGRDPPAPGVAAASSCSASRLSVVDAAVWPPSHCACCAMRTQGSLSATKGQQMATSVHDDLEQDRQGRPPRQSMDKVVFGVAAGLALVFLLYGALDSEGFGKSDRLDPGLDHDELRLVLRPDERGLPALQRVPRGDPLRQHQARPRRLRAGVLDLLVGVDDVRDRHGHRPDVLRRRRAADPPQHPADGHGGTGQRGGRAPGDGVHLLPLGLPPVVDVRRHRAGHRVLRLPQGRRQPHQRRLPAAARRPGRRARPAAPSTSSRSSRPSSGRRPRSASAPCRSPAASRTSSATTATARRPPRSSSPC